MKNRKYWKKLKMKYKKLGQKIVYPKLGQRLTTIEGKMSYNKMMKNNIFFIVNI